MIATNPKYEPNWHHELIAHELEHIEKVGDRDYKVLLVSCPPRHGKSELCSIGFPAWYLGKNPEKEIITVSYSADLAQDFGGKTRDLVAGEAFKHIFNVTLKEDDAAKARWRTSGKGSYTSVGVGGAITGRGANVLIFDDPIRNREEAESELIRNKVWDFFTSTAFTRLQPQGVVIVIQTRWHVDDLSGRVLQNQTLAGRAKIIHLPAIATHKELYREEGAALWPEKYPVPALNEIKTTIGPYDWDALYQGSPVLTENQEFDPAWYKYRTEADLAGKNTRNFLTIDTAISKKTFANYTGFVENCVDQENFWNIRAWRKKIGPDELVDAIFALHMMRKYEVIGIEKTTYTEGLKPYLDAEQRKRGTFLPIFDVSHERKEKDIRIRGLIPRYASGSVFHIQGGTKELESELRDFPRGLTDDMVDALAMQLQVADNPNVAIGASLQVFLPNMD